MKIRSGYVSNSSTSSFICVVCGNAEAGMDISYEEMEFVNCVNGHEMCQSHLTDEHRNIMSCIRGDRSEIPLELVEKLIRDNASKWTTIKPADLDDVFSKSEDEIRELVDGDLEYIGDDLYGDMPSEFCPVCNLQVIPKETIATYLMFIDDVTPEDVQKHIFKEFGDWDTFKVKLDEMKKKVYNK